MKQLKRKETVTQTEEASQSSSQTGTRNLQRTSKCSFPRMNYKPAYVVICLIACTIVEKHVTDDVSGGSSISEGVATVVVDAENAGLSQSETTA
eukprot:4616652-Pyramimonas_sp.AAC.1